MHKRSHTQQRQRNIHLGCKPVRVIPSTCFMTKRDNEWEDIPGYWCIYQKTIIQMGPINDKEKQSWSKRWNIEKARVAKAWNGVHNGNVSWAVHKELWRGEWNNDTLLQTAATTTKLQTQRPQSLWLQGQNTDREQWLVRKYKRHRKISQRICPTKRGRKLGKKNPTKTP